VRRAASGAAGNGVGTTIKYLRRTRNGAAGSGLVTTINYLWQSAAAGNPLATTIKYLRGSAGIGLGTTMKPRAQCLCVELELPPCVHKQNPHQCTFSFASLQNRNYRNSRANFSVFSFILRW
jgi:hypothetical protein